MGSTGSRAGRRRRGARAWPPILAALLAAAACDDLLGTDLRAGGPTLSAPGGLRAGWTFDERAPGAAACAPTGAAALNAGQHGGPAVLVGGAGRVPASSCAGDGDPEGCVLALTGRGHYAEAPDGPALDQAGSFTLTARIRLEGTAVALHNVVSKDDAAGRTNYSLHVGLSGHVGLFAVTFEDQPQVQVEENALGDAWCDPRGCVVAGTSDLAGAWHHLAGVYDQDSRTMKLYVDGVLEAQATFAGHGVPAVNDETLRIGRRKFTGSPAGWRGHVDEVYLYAGALDARRIAELHASCGSPGQTASRR